MVGISLVVQWLGLSASTAGDPGMIPGQRTEIPHAKNKYKLLIERKKKTNGACIFTKNPSTIPQAARSPTVHTD